MRLLVLLLAMCVKVEAQELFWPHLFVSTRIPATNTTFGLVNWWKMDENTGTLAADSADAADGTLNNSPSWVPGQINSALLFVNAQNQFLQLATNCSIGSGAFTVSFWTYRYATNQIGGYVIDDNNNDASLGFAVLADNANLALRIVCDTTDCVRNSVATVLASNDWTHIVMSWGGTVNDATTIHIYTNLVEVSYSTTGNGVGTHGQNTTTQRTIGKRAAGNVYEGILDDIRIWSRVLDAGERTNMFNWRGQP